MFMKRAYIILFLKEGLSLKFLAILWFAFRKRPWLLPPLIILAIIGLLVSLAGNPAVAPFLYTLF